MQENIRQEYEALTPEAQRLINCGPLKLLDIIFMPSSIARFERASEKANAPGKTNWKLVTALESIRLGAYITQACIIYNHFS
jgi:hypothetical protein